MSPDVPQDVDQGSLDALKDDVPLVPGALPAPADKREAETKQAQARAQEAEDRNALRKPLFWVIVTLLVMSYGSTTAMMWAYLEHAAFMPDRGIMIAWIGAAIAQLVGLTLIIARYLFPPVRG